LTVVGKSVVEFADYYFGKQSRSGVATRNRAARLFRSSYVLLAAGAGTSFLQVLKNLHTRAHHLELMSETAADENCFDFALRADLILRFHRMCDGLVWQIFSIFQYVLDARRCVGLAGDVFSCFRAWLRSSRPRIMLLGRFTELLLVAFLGLSDQDVELSLQVFEQMPQLFVSVESLLELMLQFIVRFDDVIEFDPGIGKLFFQSRKVVVGHVGTVCGIVLLIILYDQVYLGDATTFDAGRIDECLKKYYYVSFRHFSNRHRLRLLVSTLCFGCLLGYVFLLIPTAVAISFRALDRLAVDSFE
jgi:hypothetical protein